MGFLSILATIVGFGLVSVVVALFATGLMQNEIWPRIQERVQTAVNGLPLIGEDEPEEVAAPVPGVTPADSLDALLTQLETHQVLLMQREKEIQRARAEIDSVLVDISTVQTDEIARQAKLYASMKPLEAARILHSLDDPTLVAILKKMNARAASKVMGQLDPRRLARLSMEEIGRPQLSAVTPPNAGDGS